MRIINSIFMIAGLVPGFISAQVPVIGGPCQGCELVFSHMPGTLSNTGIIADNNEAGERLLVSGQVRHSDGKPAENIIVYAYQTDASGTYPTGETFHGKLRSWAQTDTAGNYSFKTIRPGAYPTMGEPQHIHLHVIEPGVGTYYIDDITFDDDPLLSAADKNPKHCRGGCGLSSPVQDKQGRWAVTRNIVLGDNIPDYQQGIK